MSKSAILLALLVGSASLFRVLPAEKRLLTSLTDNQVVTQVTTTNQVVENLAAVSPQILVLPQEIKSGQSGQEAEWAGKDEGRDGKVGHTGIWRGNESGRNVAAGGKFAVGRLIAEHAIREAGKGRAGSSEKCDKEEREHEGARGNAQNGLVKGLKVLARLAGRKEVKGSGDKRRDGDDRKCDNAKGSGYEQRGAVKVEIQGGRRDHGEGRKN